MGRESPVEIHKKRIGAVYGDIIYWQNVTKCCELSKGRVGVHNEQRSGRPSLISVELIQKTEGEIPVNQHKTIRVASRHFQSLQDHNSRRCDRKIMVQKIVRTLGAQNVNRCSQNKTGVYRTEDSHVICTGRR
jgi:hypothetical protein